MMISVTRRSFYFLAVIVVFAGFASAQDYRGKVQGSITDDAGALMPGKNVVLRNDTTKVQVTTVTNDKGHYKFDFVEPGNYSVIVEKDGFKKILQQNLIVRIQGDFTLDLKLTVGDVAATVTLAETHLRELMLPLEITRLSMAVSFGLLRARERDLSL